MLNPYRHELSYGFTTTRSSRLATVIIFGVVGAPLCLVAGILAGLVASFVSDTSGDLAQWKVVASILFGVLLMGLFTALMVFNAVKVTRTTAWLEGSRLTIRTVRPRTVDLAMAPSVGIHPTQLRWRTPGRSDMIAELVIAGPAENTYLRLSTGEGYPMPPHDISALINVLAATGVPGSANVIHYLRTY
ncbi:hypothetical protein [Actinoplanes couchii]|uniref:Uncharacterized protein n=1 Tax=Actinoplanes couchii TaxID=403638 RepID=A0ABQ3XLF8_9ACTN|nr:hypothetical protein [Actinoplanes couchii]MDR6318399.1 hypothetical protein [Actinoplanes couchii]GID59235.1 hypothetical protein Aco03nite_076390 [Actinoplanes couchii]